MTHRWGDKEYHVRRLGWRSYSVTVFSDSKMPDNIYTVNGLWCSCPAGGGTEHKHVKLVEAFRDLGEPPVNLFYEENGEWKYTNPLDGSHSYRR